MRRRESKAICNPKDVKALIAADKIFASIHKQYGTPPDWSRPPGFVSLVKIILEQQVSLASARAHFVKLESYIGAVTPDHILKLSDEEMRSCQISRQKAKYLRELSTTVLSGDLDLTTLHQLDEADIRTKLTAIKGIGHWTVDVYLLFCLQAKDIFPLGDVALINAVKELTGKDSKEQISRRAEKWRPYRSLATFFFWHYYLKKRNRAPIPL